MNLSDDWRFLFPVSSVFAPPSLAAPAASRGPLLFSPLPPPTRLLSLPFPFPPLLDAPTRSLRHDLRTFARATSSFPRIALDLNSLSEDLLASPTPPPFPPPSNLLAVLRARSSCAVVVFFPYGENAERVAFVQLGFPVSVSTPLSPTVQIDGFKHPGHRIQQLAASPVQPSWSSQSGKNIVEGFLLAATLYSVSWFRVESRCPGSPVLVPAAKQGFDATVVHACWSRHLQLECTVLLESGELCWFDLDTRRGGKMRIGFGSKDNWGNWLSCEYGAQPWTMIIASSKAILLVDLRFGDSGQHKVLARVDMPGLFETEPSVSTYRYLAFCKAGFDDFHISVVTKHNLILLDVRQPLTPVLAWRHGLENPNHVAMFQLHQLRPSKEFDWASNSGFAILVGSFWNTRFSLFCYGPKEQGFPENSRLYAWDLPSQFSLTGQDCSCSNGIIEEVFSMPISGYGSSASQQNKNSIVGYYVLPNDLSMLEPTYADFVLLRLTAFGRLEMQSYRAFRDLSYRASIDLHNDITCDESEHPTCVTNSSIYPDSQGNIFSARYRFMNLHFLSEHLEGKLCNALAKHRCNVKEHKKQIVISEDLSAFTKENSRSCSLPASDFLCNASVPMNIFEIACQSILNGLPSNILNVTFTTYKDMRALNTEKGLIEHLEVPTLLPHNKLRPFLLTKPSSPSERLTGRVISENTLIGPVLPAHVLLAIEQRNTAIESPSQGETRETDLISKRCCEVLEAFVPEISIADTGNYNGLYTSQKLNDHKSYFVYEPQLENRISLDETAVEKEKEEQRLGDSSCLHTSALPYRDENFTTFVCGKAEVSDFGLEFDSSPVKMYFDSPGMGMLSEEKNVDCLKKQFLTWLNKSKQYQDFCSSYKIQKPPQ